MTATLIACMVFLALVTIVTAVYLVYRDLAVDASTGSATAGAAAPLRLRLVRPRDAQPPRSAIESFDRWFERMLVESGLDWSPTTALLLLLLSGLLVGGVLFLWVEAPLPATTGMFIGMGLVFGYLLYTRSRRIRSMQDQLPSALEMLARAVHAGESLDQAVRLVGDNMPQPLGGEFRYCANQLDMGLSLSAVMRSLVRRVRLMDMRIFTATLKVHRQGGGNLAQTLERMAKVIRERLNSRRQIRSATSAGRASAILLGALAPLVFVYLFTYEPEYLSGLLERPLGQYLLLTAVILEFIGILWIARMLRLEY